MTVTKTSSSSLKKQTPLILFKFSMIEQKQITTIIPTFQRPKYLKKALQSVLSQTYSNFQVWVCDNASGDETASIVAEFSKKDPRVHYFCHEKNIGMLANYQF